MPTSPLYKASTVAGSAYQRAVAVRIENPLNSNPTIGFIEERVVLLESGEVVRTQTEYLTEEFDATNPLHGYIYYYLDMAYTKLREARDNPPEGPA